MRKRVAKETLQRAHNRKTDCTWLVLVASPRLIRLGISVGYDGASRLTSVTNGAYNALYSYVANSPLVSEILFRSNSTVRMTTTKQYDFLNRLSAISSVPSASSAVNFSYQYNSANQRTLCRLADGSVWLYSYDPLGQLTSAKKFWPDWTPVAGQQFEYSFDDIGNRTQTKSGGDEHGENFRVASYHANSLNQYTNRDVPGAADVMGLELATNTVTVNGATAYRKGEYFRKEISVNNSSSAVWQSIAVSATNETTVNGYEFLPNTSETFGYDLDGNITNDGRWTYIWDAENRLVSLVARSGVGPLVLLKFEYDAKSRRIRKQVWGNTSGTSDPTNDVAFAYDGWNTIGVVNATNKALLQAYVWGLDLSGSPHGAGGIGGLITIQDQVTINGTPSSAFIAYDGGNVTALLNATNGTVTAQYEYGPFGEVIRATGPMAKISPLRFSTKLQDDETGMLYYGYRYYEASTGRWLNRDPIGEIGGISTSVFMQNDGLNNVDPHGLITARQSVELTVREIFRRYLGYKTVETTGYINAMARYLPLLQKIQVQYANLSTFALYWPSKRRLDVDGRAGDILPFPTISHELAHVYDDLALGLGDDRIDEGIGYAMGQMANVVQDLYVLESRLRQAGGCSEIASLAYKWKNFWRRWGVISRSTWGDVEWDDGKNRVPLAKSDLSNLSTLHGVTLSCRAIADELNGIAARKGCCFVFICDPYDDFYTFGTGIQIDDFFR